MRAHASTSEAPTSKAGPSATQASERPAPGARPWNAETPASERRVQAVINPSARAGRARKAMRRWARGPEGETYEWIESRSPEHLKELVLAAQDEELDALLLAGGDGTVTLAAEALRDVEQRVPLGILPAGSGNDFARDLGIRGEVATPWGLLAAGAPRWIDLGEVVGGAGAAALAEAPGARSGSGPGDRYGCVASVGFDTRALEIIHGARFPRSRLLNVYASLRAIWSVPPAPLRVTWEGGEFCGPAMLAAVTNTRGYGGGFLLSPHARLDDGLLDLCVIGDLGRFRLLREFSRIFKGTHGETEGVFLAQSPWVRFEPLEGALPLCLDGELPSHEAGAGAPLELRCAPRVLQVLAPPAPASTETQPEGGAL